ncbi:Protein kinase dsk1 [Penicillium atrosanguineum]|uniref:Protein kinase dsk1 n=1 Tax=Penicillium atrosanguineum TaxID=1132637 RepID=UPI0023885CDA|nr:Protein kinase dsk1 [Penicillium atrosanguineum]KAJ5296387.1 Protein kinase dsk1 [Penicillium atrosanguineum]
MRSSLSFTVLAAVSATVSGAIIPLNGIRLPGYEPSPGTRGSHVPAWFASLVAGLPFPGSIKVTPSSSSSSSSTTTSITSSVIPTSPTLGSSPVAATPTTITPVMPTVASPASSAMTSIESEHAPEPVTSVLTLTPVHDSTPSKYAAPATKTCAGPSQKSSNAYWLDDMDQNQQGAGFAPYVNGTNKYAVYRNVMDYSVVNDGSGDQTAKLQLAIDDDNNGGTRKGKGVTRYPAEVYLPGGIYTLKSTLKLTVGTIIVGNPSNPPIIRAAPDFVGQYLVLGYDEKAGQPETSFMTLVKNVILDTTAVAPENSITALQWGVAQGSGLTNVQIRMPVGSTGHTGIDILAGSTIAVTDVTISGGATGIINSNQQVNFKNIYFESCDTAFNAKGGWTVLLQSATFVSCKLAIDMGGNGLGSMVLLDSKSSAARGPVVRLYDSSHDSGYQNSQLLIQNLVHDSSTAIVVGVNGSTHLPSSSHVDTWAWGTTVPGGYETGKSWTTQQPANLLVDGKYFIKAQPSYADYASIDIVNVKTVSEHPVMGDGRTDDTQSLNHILAENAANCKITYFPFGVYRVSDTIIIPVGTRIVGEAWAVISGYGDAFKDSSAPKAIVRVGNPGDVGNIEIQDMRFSVGEVLPGAIVVEINAAGAQPGDVGMWNTLVTVGGTAETAISNTCTSQDTKDCMAAYMVMHLTESSSAYIENFWGWTADHNLDSTSIFTVISTGRGILVESTKATWLTGTGSEHHWLYQYNFHHAANVYAGLLQSETPYMQGSGEYEKAPAPWTVNAQLGDPDFSWCSADDEKCRSALATNIDGGSNIALYNSAAWAFFDGYWNGLYNEPCDGNCQSNMMRVTGAPVNLIWYSISTRKTDVMVLDGVTNPREANHAGGWEAVIQAYRQFET